MGILIYGILILASFWRPKSKKVMFLFSVFMICLYAFSSNTSDYTNYQYSFEDMAHATLWDVYEPGYVLLILLCRALGMSFSGFRFVLGTICVTLSGLTAKRLTHYPTLALAMFSAFPFMGYISGLRAGVAGCIVVFATTYLLERSRHWKGKFILGILFAMTFHYSSALFLLFLLTKTKLSNNQLLISCVGLSAPIAFIVHMTQLPYMILSKFTDSEKVLNWFHPDTMQAKMGLGGMLYVLVVIILMVFISGRSCFQVRQLNAREGKAPLHQDTADLVFRVACIMILFLPVILLNGVFLRYLIEIVMLIICVGLEGNRFYSRYQRTADQEPASCIIDPMVLLIVMLALMAFVENRAYAEHTSYYIPLVDKMFDWFHFGGLSS